MNLSMDCPPSSRPLPAALPVPPGALVSLLGLAAVALLLVSGSRAPAIPTVAPRPSPTAAPAPAPAAPLPRLLSETGFFDENPRRFAYSPQYPLWSDGAVKRRFCSLPEGEAIDGSRPDDWQLPTGTRFWKEFSFAGRRVETRFSEKQADGAFRFATYRWDDELHDGVLVPEQGERGVHELAPSVQHDLPSRADCRACHDGRRSSVLGFGALQLSPDRDPLAPHAETPSAEALDLRELVQRGLLRHLPPALLEQSPRIAAASPTARAALGYLFGNCSGCHNRSGPLADVGLDFDQLVGADAALGNGALASSVGQRSRFPLPDQQRSLRIAPGSFRHSAVWFRMNRRDGSQMPPLGTKLIDRAGTDLIQRFIAQELTSSRLNQGKAP